MDADRFIERGIAVFANWGVFGALAVGFLMEGIARGVYALSLVGVAAAIAGFVGHLLVNAYFGRSFSPGETGLGLAALGLIVFVFTVVWLVARPSPTTIASGLSLIGALIAVAAIHLATRFGLKPTFSHFHKRAEGGGR